MKPKKEARLIMVGVMLVALLTLVLAMGVPGALAYEVIRVEAPNPPTTRPRIRCTISDIIICVTVDRKVE